VFGAVPDLLLVATIAVGYQRGPEAGAVFGFVGGLAIDCFLSSPLGVSALAFALVGYGVGVFQSGLLRSSRWIAPVLGGIGGLGGGAVGGQRRPGRQGRPHHGVQRPNRGDRGDLRRRAGPVDLPVRALGLWEPRP